MLTWSTKMWDCEAYVLYVHPNLRKTSPPPSDRMYITDHLRAFLFDFLCLKAMHCRIQ